MGWFANIFKKKKTLEEIRTWVDEELRKQEKHQHEVLQQVEQEYPGVLKDARHALGKLERAEL